jgi:hypothetical protein
MDICYHPPSVNFMVINKNYYLKKKIAKKIVTNTIVLKRAKNESMVLLRTLTYIYQ